VVFLGAVSALIAAGVAYTVFDAADGSAASVQPPVWGTQFKWTLLDVDTDEEGNKSEAYSYLYIDYDNSLTLYQAGDANGALSSQLNIGEHQFGWEHFDSGLLSRDSLLTGQPIVPTITAGLIADDKAKTIEKMKEYCNDPDSDCDCNTKDIPPVSEADLTMLPMEKDYINELASNPAITSAAHQTCKYKNAGAWDGSVPELTLVKKDACPWHPIVNPKETETCYFWKFTALDDANETMVFVETVADAPADRKYVALDEKLIVEVDDSLAADTFDVPAPCTNNPVDWDDETKSVTVTLSNDPQLMAASYAGRKMSPAAAELQGLFPAVDAVIQPCQTMPLGIHCPWTPGLLDLIDMLISGAGPFGKAVAGLTGVFARYLGPKSFDFLYSVKKGSLNLENQLKTLKLAVMANPALQGLGWPLIPFYKKATGIGKAIHFDHTLFNFKWDNLLPPHRLWGTNWNAFFNEFDTLYGDVDPSGRWGHCTGAPVTYSGNPVPQGQYDETTGTYNNDNNVYVRYKYNAFKNVWGTITPQGPQIASPDIVSFIHSHGETCDGTGCISAGPGRGWTKGSSIRRAKDAKDLIPEAIAKAQAKFLWSKFHKLPSTGNDQQRLHQCKALMGIPDSDMKEEDPLQAFFFPTEGINIDIAGTLRAVSRLQMPDPKSLAGIMHYAKAAGAASDAIRGKKWPAHGLTVTHKWKYVPLKLSDDYVARQHDFAPIGQGGSELTCTIDGNLWKKSTRVLPLIMMHPHFFGHPCRNLKWTCQSRVRGWGKCLSPNNGGGRVWKWRLNYIYKYLPVPNSAYRLWGSVGRYSWKRAVCAPLRMVGEGDARIGNGVCDCDLNTDEWGYDGGDCCPSTCTYKGVPGKCENFWCKQPKCYMMKENLIDPKPIINAILTGQPLNAQLLKDSVLPFNTACLGKPGKSGQLPPPVDNGHEDDETKCLNYDNIIGKMYPDGTFISDEFGFGDEADYAPDDKPETINADLSKITDISQLPIIGELYDLVQQGKTSPEDIAGIMPQ